MFVPTKTLTKMKRKDFFKTKKNFNPKNQAYAKNKSITSGSHIS